MKLQLAHVVNTYYFSFLALTNLFLCHVQLSLRVIYIEFDLIFPHPCFIESIHYNSTLKPESSSSLLVGFSDMEVLVFQSDLVVSDLEDV